MLNSGGTPLRLNRVRGRRLANEEFLAPLLAGEPPRNSVDDHVKWLASRPVSDPKMETAT